MFSNLIIPILVPSPPLAKIPVNFLPALDGRFYARSDPGWVLVITLNSPVGNVRSQHSVDGVKTSVISSDPRALNRVCQSIACR